MFCSYQMGQVKGDLSSEKPTKYKSIYWFAIISVSGCSVLENNINNDTKYKVEHGKKLCSVL